MDWGDFLTALALVFIIEGLMPFIHPSGWRETIRKVISFNDRQLRFIGISSMIVGLILLYLVR